jgi:hypothetical protein
MDTAVGTPVLQVTFTLTRGDFVRGFLVHSMRTIRWISGITGALGVLLAIGIMLPSPDAAPGPEPVDAVLEFFAMAIGYPALLAVVAVIQFRGMREQAKTMTWSFFPDRIECVSALSQGTMKWQGLVRVRESKSAFLFYPNRAAFSIVPKHALTAEGIQTVRRLAIDGVGKKRVKVDFAAYQAGHRSRLDSTSSPE